MIDYLLLFIMLYWRGRIMFIYYLYILWHISPKHCNHLDSYFSSKLCNITYDRHYVPNIYDNTILWFLWINKLILYFVSMSFLAKLQMKHLPSISLINAYRSSLSSPKVSNIMPNMIWMNRILKTMKNVKSKKYLPQY